MSLLMKGRLPDAARTRLAAVPAERARTTTITLGQLFYGAPHAAGLRAARPRGGLVRGRPGTRAPAGVACTVRGRTIPQPGDIPWLWVAHGHIPAAGALAAVRRGAHDALSLREPGAPSL